jgi:protein-tyrosine-phosphatase
MRTLRAVPVPFIAVAVAAAAAAAAAVAIPALAPPAAAQDAKPREGIAEPRREPRSAPRVLFICPHGAGLSVLASAYFKHLAAEQGIRVETDAVGTEPGPEVGPAVAARLKAQGIAVPIAKPRAVTADDVTRADIVIAIRCDLAGNAAVASSPKLRRWDDVPDIGKEFDAADQALRAKAKALLDEIAQAQQARPR